MVVKLLTYTAVAFFITLIFILVLKQPAQRWEWVDKPGQRKHHMGVVPLIGGVAMLFGFIVTAMLALDEAVQPYQSLFAAMILLFIVGILDDFHDLTARCRFLVQASAALIMTLSGDVYLSNLGNLLGLGDISLHLWSIPFTVFCVIGGINAFNMIDGIDGLAGGVAFIATLWLALFAFLAGHHELDMIVLLLLAAAICAFLCFNLRHPWCRRASVFMGDSGSMMLGLVLAWFLADLAQGEQRAFAPVVAIWILGLPLMDTLSVMTRRIARGQNPFRADRQHLHHILLQAGYSDAQATAVLLMASAALGGIGFAGWCYQVPDYVLFYVFLGLFMLYCFVLNHFGAAQQEAHSRSYGY